MLQRLVLLFILLVGGMGLSVAQDDIDTTMQTVLDMDVFVTTQDLSSLRMGPGTGFDRYLVVPPAVTIPAIGRSANGRWVQVIYENQRGWIASFLLVWSGDFLSLPIDGIAPEPFVRRTTIVANTTVMRDTPLYRDAVDPSNYVGSLPPGTEVEIVARLGDSGFRQYQILYNGQTYWVGSWNLTLERGATPNDALNTVYRFPYGRLRSTIGNQINSGQSRLNSISSIWSSLSQGRSISCANIPQLLGQVNVPITDLDFEPAFAPLTIALQAGYDSTNTAITLFEDACNQTDAFLTQDDIDTAFAEIDNAQRNYNVASSILSSLHANDPFSN